MRTFVRLFGVMLPLLLVGACQARQPEAEYRPTATVKDIMDSMVEPNADILWDSVQSIVTLTGIEDRQPRTDEEWMAVRRSAVQVVEAMNLILIPGRVVAKPGEKAENPEVELAPEEIEKAIANDRAAWTTLTHGMHDQAVAALRAIDARDAQALSAAGGLMDAACESCHKKYWYPDNKGGQAGPK